MSISTAEDEMDEVQRQRDYREEGNFMSHEGI